VECKDKKMSLQALGIASKVLLMNVIPKDAEVRKVADLGKPGSVNHVVELEVRVPRRTAIRLFVPFVIASMFMKAGMGKQ
jgi:hypothetical protein